MEEKAGGGGNIGGIPREKTGDKIQGGEKTGGKKRVVPVTRGAHRSFTCMTPP